MVQVAMIGEVGTAQVWVGSVVKWISGQQERGCVVHQHHQHNIIIPHQGQHHHHLLHHHHHHHPHHHHHHHHNHLLQHSFPSIWLCLFTPFTSVELVVILKKWLQPGQSHDFELHCGLKFTHATRTSFCGHRNFCCCIPGEYPHS